MTPAFVYKKNGFTIDYTNMMDEYNSSKFAFRTVELIKKAEIFKDISLYIKRQRNSDELGFLKLPYNIELIDEIKKMVDSKRPIMNNLLVLGIGGSALGNIAIHNALNDPFGNQNRNKPCTNIFVEDNIDPDRIHSLLEYLDWSKTVVNVITKSGTTPETMATFFIVKKILQEKLGKEYKNNVIVTTDPEKGILRRIALEEGFDILHIPQNVGGRFSVLSAVGLFSAYASGVDISELLHGARDMDSECRKTDFFKNPAYICAAMKYIAYLQGIRINVFMPYSSALKTFSDWYCQLIGESLGKKFDLNGNIHQHGITPVSAVGSTDQHSQLQLYIEGPEDKLIIFLFVENYKNKISIYDENLPDELSYFKGVTLNDLLNAEGRATATSLTERGRLNFEIKIEKVSPYIIGGLFYLFEMVTLIMGKLLNINAFDQPGVDRGKVLTKEFLKRK
jgi:glucose-6-phosphate isomerase